MLSSNAKTTLVLFVLLINPTVTKADTIIWLVVQSYVHEYTRMRNNVNCANYGSLYWYNRDPQHKVTVWKVYYMT